MRSAGDRIGVEFITRGGDGRGRIPLAPLPSGRGHRAWPPPADSRKSRPSGDLGNHPCSCSPGAEDRRGPSSMTFCSRRRPMPRSGPRTLCAVSKTAFLAVWTGHGRERRLQRRSPCARASAGATCRCCAPSAAISASRRAPSPPTTWRRRWSNTAPIARQLVLAVLRAVRSRQAHDEGGGSRRGEDREGAASMSTISMRTGSSGAMSISSTSIAAHQLSSSRRRTTASRR